MGNCVQRNDKSKEIDKEMKDLEKAIHKQTKILLLGPGESGKSTIFKQMRVIQDDGGFSTNELWSFKADIHANCISQMTILVKSAVELRINIECTDLVQKLFQPGGAWTSETGNIIKALWVNKTIRNFYDTRDTYKNHFYLNDTAKYFFDHIDRISDEQYQPTVDDVLRVRVKSKGIEEAEFVFDKTLFRVVDVGGQRSERRKWIHCFHGVSAVLFCASLSDYDLPLAEDPRQNRLVEALNLFGEVANQDTFRETAIIFFLNKTDLFQEKILSSPIENIEDFKDYTPPQGRDLDQHYQAGTEYIRRKFIELVDKKRRTLATIYVHLTCALDTEQVEVVIKAVRKWMMDILLGALGVGGV